MWLAWLDATEQGEPAHAAPSPLPPLPFGMLLSFGFGALLSVGIGNENSLCENTVKASVLGVLLLEDPKSVFANRIWAWILVAEVSI